MSAASFIVLVIALCLVQRGSSGIPSDIQKCKAADLQCIAKTITDILHKNPNGNKELGLPKLEPVHLDELVVAKKEGNRPLSLNFKFSDLDVYGLSKTIVTKAVGFEKDPQNSKFEVYVTIPELTLRGKYETDGKVLLLPIVGKGNAEIRLKNFKTGVKVKLNTVDENGKLRMSIAQMKVQSEPELMVCELENLFNGNKALSDELLNVINQNWKDVWTELESGINDGYARIIKFLITDVFKVITYDEFYTE